MLHSQDLWESVAGETNDRISAVAGILPANLLDLQTSTLDLKRLGRSADKWRS